MCRGSPTPPRSWGPDPRHPGLLQDRRGASEARGRPLRPEGVVRDVGTALESLAVAGGVELICSLAPEVPATVIGDQLRVRQIIFNLLGNAVKFTEEGRSGARRGAAGGGRGGPPHLLLEIEDTGIGIPADKLPHIFESFSQADIPPPAASGLGAWDHHRPPVDPADARDHRGGERGGAGQPLLGPPAPDRGPAAPAPPPAGRLSGRRALVVEVNPTQREVICAALTREGMACDAVACRGRWRPGARAADRTCRARRSPAPARPRGGAHRGQYRPRRQPPCLFLTCAARRPEGQGAGVGYLGKPFLAEDLTAAAERLLGLVPGGRGRCACGGGADRRCKRRDPGPGGRGQRDCRQGHHHLPQEDGLPLMSGSPTARRPCARPWRGATASP